MFLNCFDLLISKIIFKNKNILKSNYNYIFKYSLKCYYIVMWLGLRYLKNIFLKNYYNNLNLLED